MIGVPSLDLCHRGPISRLFCPSLCDLRMGIKMRSKKTVNKRTVSITAKKAMSKSLYRPFLRHQSIFFVLFCQRAQKSIVSIILSNSNIFVKCFLQLLVIIFLLFYYIFCFVYCFWLFVACDRKGGLSQRDFAWIDRPKLREEALQSLDMPLLIAKQLCQKGAYHTVGGASHHILKALDADAFLPYAFGQHPYKAFLLRFP